MRGVKTIRNEKTVTFVSFSVNELFTAAFYL